MKKLISILMATIMTVAITVVPVQAATYPNAGQVFTLKQNIQRCKTEKGFTMDYEEMAYSVINRFVNIYIPNDTTKGIDSSVLAYEKNAIAELYAEVNANVNAYLDGTKTPLTVNRTNMQNLSVDGKYIYDGANHVFSLGYGFFGHAQSDIPNFQSFGVNNIQMEIGPHQTWGTESLGWNVYLGTEGINASATVVTTDAHSGSKSLNMVFSDTNGANRYVAAERAIPCKPNTTYTLGCFAKGSATDWNAWMTFDWVASGRIDFVGLSTSSWKKFERTYTTGADQTSMSPLVLVENTANLYLDDFYVYEEGSDINLLSNAGFESAVYPVVEDLKVHLNNAQNSNVGVSLLLAPHYLKNIAAANGITTTTDSAATFINFDINHANAKKIIEAHIRGVLSNVQDYTCIDSICISNEPWFDTRWFDDYKTQFQNYAIEKHGSLANAKSAYGQISNTINMPETNFFGNYAINAKAYDWMEFNDKIFTEWHEWMAGIVREYFPNTPIHSKVMENIITAGETKERVELARGTDYEMLGEFLDYSGIDGSNYTEADYYEMMFLYDYLQSAIGKPVYNSETHIIEDYGWSNPVCFDFTSQNTAKALYKMWQGAIHGRSMSTVWAWQRHYTDGDDATTSAVDVGSSGNSSFYGGILFRPDLVAGIGKMNLDFARLADRIVELQENAKKVAVFYSKPSRLWNASYITNLMAVYKELVTNGYDVGVVSEKSIAKLSEYDTLIIPTGAKYTTQVARTAVENFASNGGKVLYGSSDVLTLSEYNKSLTTNTISDATTYSLSALSANAVTLKDASTGSAPSNVEWQYAVTDDKILVNIANNSTTAKNIDVYYNGTKIMGLTDLIAGETVDSTISLAAYEPKLVEYTLVKSEPNEIVDLTFDSENNKITWKAVGENVGSVTLYKVGADKNATYITNTTGKEFTDITDGTYIVCPVTKDGVELEGAVITTPDSVTISVNRTDKTVNVALKNRGANYVRAKVLIEAYAGGEVVSYGYVRTFASPNATHNIDVLLPYMGTIDNVKVTVFDDINNVLTEAIK